jgi:hypothetical protein
VLLDADVAALYGVATKAVNQAVKNNPEKFPAGYIFELQKYEVDGVQELRSKFLTAILPPEIAEDDDNLRSNFSTANTAMSRVPPKAFTEKGLYMLATILKGDLAVQTTIAIVETFAKLRELSRTLAAVTKAPDQGQKETLLQKGGRLIGDLLGNHMEVTDSETTLELDLAVVKVKHSVRQKRK